MAYETIIYTVQDGVATLTLNRPEKRNALTPQMYREILDVLTTVEEDNAVRALIITGAGKGFCSGADLTTIDITQDEISIGDALREGLNQIVLRLWHLEKPVIAALNGVAAGAGAGIALACDLRVASEQASFVFAAFVNIGIIPDSGTTYFLPRLVGASRALELALMADAGNRLGMEQALQWGLVNRVVAADQVMTEANALGVKLSQMATRAIGLTKRAVYHAAQDTLENSLEREAQLQTLAFETRDFEEGVQAFLEKRPPDFTGK
jgi:2-(1,2-epoxy-1,2-dihydrophenyl)acetyl-CoA isomerase